MEDSVGVTMSAMECNGTEGQLVGIIVLIFLVPWEKTDQRSRTRRGKRNHGTWVHMSSPRDRLSCCAFAVAFALTFECLHDKQLL